MCRAVVLLDFFLGLVASGGAGSGSDCGTERSGRRTADCPGDDPSDRTTTEGATTRARPTFFVLGERSVSVVEATVHRVDDRIARVVISRVSVADRLRVVHRGLLITLTRASGRVRPTPVDVEATVRTAHVRLCHNRDADALQSHDGAARAARPVRAPADPPCPGRSQGPSPPWRPWRLATPRS